MSLAKHCDRDGCDSWQHIDAEPSDWAELHFVDDVRHFCSIDCVMNWAAANSQPSETIVVTDPH
ncbi:hypothetical protein [Nocardia camponoti]|uniref:hypothetical protein n=1 Tax=Nocardia camponoti TaxID=1616106 RepID=UPI0016639EB6|nr:hypothetical protein [Nocardia camponoti]